MGGGFLVVVVWAAVWVWAGRGCSSRKAGWLVLWFPACVVGLGWLACLVVGVEDTPVLLLLPALCGGGGWWVPPRALCVWGWHAVGVLGQCALVAWLVWGSWLWGFLGGCGWVGCELYSGREHLTVRFLRQMFLFCSCVFVVCFFERSVDALASGADEGRGGLRYSSGSRLAGCDPRVSEWGDPARVMSCHLHLNCIGCGG